MCACVVATLGRDVAQARAHAPAPPHAPCPALPWHARARTQVTATLLAVIYAFVMGMCLSNMLVGLVTNELSRSSENQALKLLLSKVQIIDELEATIPRWIERLNPQVGGDSKLRGGRGGGAMFDRSCTPTAGVVAYPRTAHPIPATLSYCIYGVVVGVRVVPGGQAWDDGVCDV